MSLSVADQLWLDSMDPRVRALIERVVADRLEDRSDEAFNEGFEHRQQQEREEQLVTAQRRTPPPQPRLFS